MGMVERIGMDKKFAEVFYPISHLFVFSQLVPHLELIKEPQSEGEQWEEIGESLSILPSS